MLKKLVVAALVLASSVVTAADIKIGVVDIAMVESKAPQVKTIGEKLKARFKEQQDALVGLRDEYQKIADKAKKEEMTMTFSQKLDASRKLKALEEQLKMKKTFLDEDVSYAQKQEIQNIRVKIQQAVQKVAADGKFDLILLKQSTMYAGPSVDITEQVVAIISNPAG